MASAYTAPIPSPSTLPAHLRVQVLVMRDDGRDLSPEDIDAARVAFPAEASADAGVIGTTAPTTKRAKPKARKAPAKRSTAKRAAAKRPA